jgi:protein TonB
MTFIADPDERLITPPRMTPSERSRFAMILGLCLLVHAALFAFFFLENALAPLPPTAEQEIPVEVLVEPPPEKTEEPTKPKEPPLKQQQAPREEYEKPAFEAPKAENKESLERETRDKETAAPKVSPPKEQATPEPAPQKEASPAQKLAPEPPAQAAQKQAEDMPEAEIVEPAEPTPQTEQDKDLSQSQAKVPPKQTTSMSIAEQVAALVPFPDFKLGSAAKPTPVSGGNAKRTYLTILYGLIVPRMQIPPSARALRSASDGIVAFYIDERGNLTHQSVVRGSGSPDLDAAAIAALRRASPFPAPPVGHPRSILFHYNSR